MNHYITRKLFLLCAALTVVILIGCGSTTPEINTPDVNAFVTKVGNSSLADSIRAGKLCTGMPYYIVENIFKNWTDSQCDRKIPVVSLGSKQELNETEGLGRNIVDYDVGVLLDKYETKNGELLIWYQIPDFYRLDLSNRDTILVFLPDTTLSSRIKCLSNKYKLTTRDQLFNEPVNQELYAEVHYVNNSWRTSSSWYTMHVLDDGKTFMIRDLQYEIYPVEMMMLNGKRIYSFNWR